MDRPSTYQELKINTKQIISVISPLVIIGMMYPIFQFLGNQLGNSIGWYLGLWVYWIIWGGIFPWIMIGKESIIRLIRPQKLTLKLLIMVVFPVLMAAIFRISTGMEYDKPALWFLFILISTNLGNGFFEEVLWRGMYLELFPESDILNELNYQLIMFGFLFLTVGIITGAVWANSAWGRYWGWDPKETWSLITWIVYAALIHARMMRG